MSFWTSFRDRLRGQRRKKVPILGVEGCGKSSLILTLGHYISLHELGAVGEEGRPDLFGEYLSYTMRGEPFPATTRWEQFNLHVKRIPEAGGEHTLVDLLLTSEDIPGGQFRQLVEELRRHPNVEDWLGKARSDLLSRFTELLSSCDGFLFVIDLVRDDPNPGDRSAEDIWAAFADQIQPIMTGVMLALKMNADMANKPIFFVFSKPDLHKLSPAEVERYFRRGMAIPLGQLRRELINVRHYNVQCAGWGMESELDKLGVDVLLSDLAHAIGAAR